MIFKKEDRAEKNYWMKLGTGSGKFFWNLIFGSCWMLDERC
ncbi:MAG: hypothetical protein ACI9Y7_001360 [Dokdonia sp.]|jgi:hypothetical protein